MEIGLRQQIAQAKTVEEVKALLELGLSNYTKASAATRNHWLRTADRRIAALENGNE